MKYYDPSKKQSFPNKEIDKFLLQLHILCKRNKMCINTSNPKFPLVVETYSKTSVKNMLGNVYNNLKIKKEEDEDDTKTNK